MRSHIAPISAKSSHHLFKPFAEVLDTVEVPGAIVRAGFAYATLGGVQSFISQVESLDNWRNVKKEFLIGIHHAITEPSALEALRSIAHSRVRVLVPGTKLRMSAFDAKPVFHPKVLAITTTGGGNVRFLQCGSTNMTSSAMGKLPENHEFSLAIQAEDSTSVDDSGLLDAWWSSLWNQSRLANRQFILKYAELRKKIFDQNPILQSATEAPTSIGKAKHFFSEVGAGSGPPGFRHQIEFPESLARFFGRVQRRRRGITLRRGEQTWSGRPLTHKKTTYGVEIWRLGMPTQATGGDPIAERAIRFTRTPRARTFEFEVVDVDGVDFREWVRLANIGGHIGATHGQRARQYGFYD